MLTRFALDNRMLMLAAVLICLVAGPLSFLTHPAREDPSIRRNFEQLCKP